MTTFFQARLNVSLPGIDRETAQKLVDGAEVVVGDLLEPADALSRRYRRLAGLLRHVESAGYLKAIMTMAAVARELGVNALGIHIANDSFPEGPPEHHAEPSAAAVLALR